MDPRTYPIILCAVVFGGALAPAAQAAELSVRGPAQCPDAGELKFRVERAIGVPLVRAAPLRFDVSFEPGASPGSPYTARLEAHGDEVRGAREQRVFTSGDCGELGDVVGVVIALALGSNAAAAEGVIEPGKRMERRAERTPAVAAALVAASGSAPPRDLPDASAEREGAALTPALSLWGLVDGGSLPAPALGVGLGVELRWRGLGLRALGSLLFEQHVELRGTAAPAPGADLGLALGSLSACAAPFGSLHDRVAASVCGGWEVGRLGGVGTGVQEPRRRDAWWSAPRIDAGLSWALPGTQLRLGALVTAAAPLLRDDFFLRDLGSVHRPPSVVGRLAAGVDVSFE